MVQRSLLDFIEGPEARSERREQEQYVTSWYLGRYRPASSFMASYNGRVRCIVYRPRRARANLYLSL